MEQWFSKRGPLGTINITWELVRMYFASPTLDPRRHESLSLESGIDPLRVILLPLTLTSTARD